MLPTKHSVAGFYPANTRTTIHDGNDSGGFKFTNTAAHEFKPGMLYLGRDHADRNIGIETEKGAITIASARTGKDASIIIPNLLKWEGNSLTIDPAGEAVEATYQDLEKRGYRVVLLDAFKKASVPSRLRVSCNLLASVDPTSLTVREDIRVIADGLVMRNNPDHNDWADKRLEVIAGAIAEIVTIAPPEHRTLLDIVEALNLPATPEKGAAVSQLEAFLTGMRDNTSCAGVARRGGTTALNSMKASNKQGPEGAALGGAQSELDWISSLGMGEILGTSSFDLSELKTGKVALFLVIPSEYIEEHGRFLRLFVRCALEAMQKGGKVNTLNPNGKLNRPCLFLLNEFHSLGNLSIVKKAAGALPKFGVHLWPFLQNIGQLNELYGKEAASTFFGNADAHIFFGTSDPDTLEYASRVVGLNTLADIGAPPPYFAPTHITREQLAIIGQSAIPVPPGSTVNEGSNSGWSNGTNNGYSVPHSKGFIGEMMNGHSSGMSSGSSGGTSYSKSHVINHPDHGRVVQGHIDAMQMREMLAQREKIERAQDENARRDYEHRHKRLGQPRLYADQIRELVAKKDGDKVARSMLVIGKGSDIFNLKLAPYFVQPPAPPILVPRTVPTPALTAPALAVPPKRVQTEQYRVNPKPEYKPYNEGFLETCFKFVFEETWQEMFVEVQTPLGKIAGLIGMPIMVGLKCAFLPVAACHDLWSKLRG